jgi:hypothetical protein
MDKLFGQSKREGLISWGGGSTGSQGNFSEIGVGPLGGSIHFPT